ncbi:UDP-N-acetylmuramoyl-L-alanine--D-glutamate ligase [Corynebacterium sp. TAE3-ERU12]|uniref:UDP-N-acetylmuramoyl-L-alanine--D-glutamate ligase n=1 Tax=Corynebacterium sp. TAE3-ERU12 TaxID=2849491 RepID=UPI001C46DAA4|nr:UDP-N-acetylmuramoyl-L-alanine--D-glutamate ligase [Corynebacterium sp. TAE3-ERU12]MBV7296223.1 UDP-N-acetylmuramoyl-L-alanine--D-glutamate ligase [Corynebacterium sp. TAE3-ERU12]
MTSTTTAPSTPADAELLNLVRSGRIIVAGAGVSGAGIAGIVHDIGATDIVIADDNTERATALAQRYGAQACTVDQACADLGSTSLVAVSPGWRPDSALPSAALAAGVPVVGEVALARAGDRAGIWGAPRTWLVVTGTNGKTTTTGMLASILGARGQAVGNIGVALHEALTASPRVEILAAELSSFQLHWAPQVRPDAGALLNLAEDHIDWHGSYAEYARAKAHALTGDIAIYGAEDDDVESTVERLRADGDLAPTVVGFTAGVPEPGQVGAVDGWLVDRAFADQDSEEGTGIIATSEITPPGVRGVRNAAAAAALARAVGIDADTIAAGLRSFEVAAHRGQIVHRSHNGTVAWCDDSKATNPHAADAAMAGVDNFVWVAGGQLKGADITDVVNTHVAQMSAAVLLGQDAAIIADALRAARPDLPVTVIDDTDPEAAMRAACAAASAAVTPGGVVLLAPAAASLDMYTGMSQRGELFAAGAREATGEDV